MATFKFTILSALAFAAVGSVRADSASLVASLKLAPNEVARVNLLNDTDVSLPYLPHNMDSHANLSPAVRLRLF